MEKTIIRVFRIDEDACLVKFQYNDAYGIYNGDYPDFQETPRYTKKGYPWVTVMQDGCIYAEGKREAECLDCGTCRFLKKQMPRDLIGICTNEYRRKKV